MKIPFKGGSFNLGVFLFLFFEDIFCFSWLLTFVASGFCGFWLSWFSWLLASVAFGFRCFHGFWLLWLLAFVAFVNSGFCVAFVAFVANIKILI